MRIATILATAAVIAVPAVADHHMDASEEQAATQLAPMVMTTPIAAEAPGQRDTSAVTGGDYQIDAAHTTATFTVDHLGFSSYTGQFGNPSGTLTLDMADLANSSVSVSFPVSSVSTTSDQLDQHLQTDDFFNAAEYPEVTFTSTDVVVDGENAAIRGDLTIRDVTKSVVLQTEFYGAGTNPMSSKENVGFRAVTSIVRSDFGMDYAVPGVSDEVLLVIDAAFTK
ncbi:MAG: YceI family protein [Pacificimonas sp.]